MFVFVQVTGDQWQGQVICGGAIHQFPSFRNIALECFLCRHTHSVQASSANATVCYEGRANCALALGKEVSIVSSYEVPSCEPPTGARATGINTLKCVHLKFLWSSPCVFAWRGKQPHNRQCNVPSVVNGSLIGEQSCPALEILKAYCLFCKVLVIK